VTIVERLPYRSSRISGGTRTKVRRPESEWLTLDAVDLRIVDEALWQSAHAVLAGKARAYIRLAGGKLIGGRKAHGRAGR
jgi:hypothetical protein